MKYNNYSIIGLGGGGLLHFVQHFLIGAVLLRKMLHYGDNFIIQLESP